MKIPQGGDFVGKFVEILPPVFIFLPDAPKSYGFNKKNASIFF